MNNIFRKTLLAGAVAALAAAPMLASAEGGKTGNERGEVGQPTSQYRSGTAESASLQGLTPSQLRGTEVVGPNGEQVGTVKAVVRSRDEKNIQAVISAGGMMGMGDREVAVPLNSLRYDGDKLRISATEEQLKARPEYQSEKFVELEPSDQPISEFSAFETVPGERGATWERSRTHEGLDMMPGDRDTRMRDKPYPEGNRVTP